MRNARMVMVSLLFAAAPVFAQQSHYTNSVSVFVSDLSIAESSATGTRFGSDFGAALEHMFSDRVSAELAVTSQRIGGSVTTFPLEGFPTTTTRSGRIYPIDATASYHFFTDSRWKPYLGAGARYVSDSVRVTGPLGDNRFTRRSTDPEITGGVTFQFNPRLGLRLDAKQILGSSGDIGADAKFKASAGLSLRF